MIESTRPEWLDGDRLIHWQTQEDFYADLGIDNNRPAPAQDSIVHKCQECGKAIDAPKGQFRTYAKCRECNDKTTARIAKRAGPSTTCKRCGNRERAWIRGRFAGLCIDCADIDRKAFTAGNDSLFRK